MAVPAFSGDAVPNALEDADPRRARGRMRGPARQFAGFRADA